MQNQRKFSITIKYKKVNRAKVKSLVQSQIWRNEKLAKAREQKEFIYLQPISFKNIFPINVFQS